MATLALAAAGAAAGSALLPAGFSVLGTTITGATLGSQLGSLAGSVIDNALFGSSGQGRAVSGPRLTELKVTASTEGAAVPRLYGKARLGGQLLWASDYVEEVVTSNASGGGKGGLSAGSGRKKREYKYYANFAVAMAEGEISGIGQVWADGNPLDLSSVTFRLYHGSDTQLPDSLIESFEGADAVPAYRGIAYIVFEHLPIAPYGNRLPQLSFEVHRSIDTLHTDVRAVVIIPGSGEFIYSTQPVSRNDIGNQRPAENVHTLQAETDWIAGIDQLEAALPNAKSATLVVSWFGTDLRAGACDIRPGVEIAAKSTHPHVWSVAGEDRASAHTISQKDKRPAYGGTPSDQTVIEAIRDLTARGISVALSPFILMDIGDDNMLPDPYDGNASQPAYPWRGRITVDPAPGASGSADKTAAAGQQLNKFVGAASVSDFSVANQTVQYSGPAEWSYRRHILHYAWLAKAAGGVDAFVIGTELRGLTQVRDHTMTYPFVAALVQLAADVKSVLGAATKVTYAADWSEYFGHQPSDGSGDVYFHLDPLWASPNIDAIGIDLYWPLSDWRDGDAHTDAAGGKNSVYDLDYLKSNINGGEGYDWYYASAADRDNQIRTPITDEFCKPWVFRYKDVVAWWSNAHFDRPGGVEATTPTAWVAQSKPIWLTEVGCPAIDKGANQPNVFFDPKSTESAVPYYSDGRRDDLIQRQYLRAIIEGFDPNSAGYINGLNPTSAVYNAPMVDVAHIHTYAWDSRPQPAFPSDTDVWSDGSNWPYGHWLNGRIASMPLANVVASLLSDHGFSDFDVGNLEGVVPGYTIDRILSARDAIQPLELAYFFDSIESDGKIVFRQRGRQAPVVVIGDDDLADVGSKTDLITFARRQETDLPASAKITYIAAGGAYKQAVVEARRLVGASGRVAQAQLPLVLDPGQATALAESWLFDAWAARERAKFVLPPSQLALEAGDAIIIRRDDKDRLFRITEIGDHGTREITALSLDRRVYSGIPVSDHRFEASVVVSVGQPDAEFLDLPLLRGDEPDTVGYVAASVDPWPGEVTFYRSPETSGYTVGAVAETSATLGRLVAPLALGPPSRLDLANTIEVKLDGGSLTSVTHLRMLGGANAAAIQRDDGSWEIIQFERAELVGAGTYCLTRLLRGQRGTDVVPSPQASRNARFVLLDGAIAETQLSPDEIGLALNWRYGPSARDLGHVSYADKIHTFIGLGRRPLSPVHARGQRVGDGVNISWIRRTRRDGDGWTAVDVPLGETRELYEVDILNGTTVVRTLSADSPTVTYSTNDQIADFGSLQRRISVNIYQISETWGRGVPLNAVV